MRQRRTWKDVKLQRVRAAVVAAGVVLLSGVSMNQTSGSRQCCRQFSPEVSQIFQRCRSELPLSIYIIYISTFPHVYNCLWYTAVGAGFWERCPCNNRHPISTYPSYASRTDEPIMVRCHKPQDVCSGLENMVFALVTMFWCTIHDLFSYFLSL